MPATRARLAAPAATPPIAPATAVIAPASVPALFERQGWGRSVALGIIVLGFAVCAGAATIPDEVKAGIADRVDRGKSPSIVVGIVDPESTDYFGYGKTSLPGGAAVDENTVYEIGSITKVFTAILLADMVAKGEVSLTDPIEKYLPKEVKAPTADGKSILLENLSIQNSGLPGMPSNFRPKDQGNPYADYTVEMLYENLGKVIPRPGIGVKYQYSNVGVGLLGHLLELASGKDFEALVLERIATPLGMPDTRIAFNDSMIARLAKPHAEGKEGKNWDIGSLAGAGALRSTAKDMIRFMQANLGQIDSPLIKAMEETHKPRSEAGLETMRIGLGWHILTTPAGNDIVWHNGGTGGYHTFAGFLKNTKTGVVVLANDASQNCDDIGFHLLDASVPMGGLIERTAIEVSRDILERYVGRYALEPGGFLDVELRDDGLYAKPPGVPFTRIFAESETAYFLEEGDVLIEFQKDEKGTVNGFVVHQGAITFKGTKQ